MIFEYFFKGGSTRTEESNTLSGSRVTLYIIGIIPLQRTGTQLVMVRYLEKIKKFGVNFCE